MFNLDGSIDVLRVPPGVVERDQETASIGIPDASSEGHCPTQLRHPSYDLSMRWVIAATAWRGSLHCTPI